MEINRTDYPPGVTKKQELAPGVFKEDKRHWALGSYAGEGRMTFGGDSSGCLNGKGLTRRPLIAIYRHYTSEKGIISCFLSYPDGMGVVANYFWEICSLEGELFEGVERFSSEAECEQRIIELLL